MKAMGQRNTITATLATLIQKENVPLQAVALAGEAIAIDARLSDFEQGASRRSSFEKWAALTEAYDVLLKRTQSITADFERDRDGHVLIAALTEIKARLAAL
jgi:hypothetical protein